MKSDLFGKLKSTLDPLASFDVLPDSAHVRISVVAALRACSKSTVWRHVHEELIPKPKKFSGGITAWNVGELRKVLGLDGGAA